MQEAKTPSKKETLKLFLTLCLCITDLLYHKKQNPRLKTKGAGCLDGLKNCFLKTILQVSVDLILVAELAVSIPGVAIEQMQADSQHKVISYFIINLRRNPALIIVGTAP